MWEHYWLFRKCPNDAHDRLTGNGAMAPTHAPRWARRLGGIACPPCGAKACSANSIAGAADPPAPDCAGTCGLVAMTSASHAEGRQFDPGQVYFCIRALHRNDAQGWCVACCPCLALPILPKAPLEQGPVEPSTAQWCPRISRCHHRAPRAPTNRDTSPKLPRRVRTHFEARSWVL